MPANNGFEEIVVTAPDGKEYTVTAPVGATDEEIISFVQQNYASAAEPTPVTAPAPVANAPQAPVGQAAPAAPTPVARPQTPLSRTVDDSTQMVNSVTERNRPDIERVAQELWQSGVQDIDTLNARLSEQFGPREDGSNLYYNPEAIAMARARDEWFRLNPTVANPGNFVFNEQTGELPVDVPQTMTDEFGTSVQRGLANLANTATAVGALSADVVGADETAQTLLDKYVNDAAAIQLNYPSSVEGVRDIESFGDAGRYAVGVLGEFLPEVTSMAGVGVLGAQAGRIAARRVATQFVEERMARGMTQEAAERALAETAQRWATRGATAGVTGSSVAQSGGEVYGQTYAQTGERAPWMSITAGSVAGMLDSILPRGIAVQLTSDLKDRMTNRLLREGLEGMSTEGLTEAAQTFIEQLPAAVITGESPFTEEMYLQMEEAFVRGAIGGGAVNAGTAMFTGNDPNNRPEPTGNFGYAETIYRPTANPRRATRLYPRQLQRTAQEMAQRVDHLTESWADRPNISVEPNFSQLQGVDDDALGVYINGEIVLNAEALIAEADERGLTLDDMVAGVTYHEALGHHSLDREFGEGLNDLLDSFYYKSGRAFRERVETWMDKNPDAYQGDPDRHLRAVEEVLSEYAERGGQQVVSMMDRVKNYVKSFARRAGMTNLPYSTREIKAILGIAQRNMVEGRQSNSSRSFSLVPRYAQSTSAGFRRPSIDSRAQLEDRKMRRKQAADNTQAEIDAAIRAGYDPSEVGLPSARYAKSSNRNVDRIRLTRKHGQRNPDGTMGFTSEGNVIGPESQAAKTFLKELGLFNNGELMRMGSEDAITRAERIGIDQEWLDYYNDAYLRSYYGPDSAPDTPQPDMNKYLPDIPKYARKSKSQVKPLTAADLTAEDLVESKNAIEILDSMIDSKSTVTLTTEELLKELMARGVAPSQIVRRADIEPGKLTRDMLKYDIAATKLQDRLTTLYSKLQDGSATQNERVEFVKTQFALDDVASNLFGFQSEAGRMLNAIKKMENTYRKITSLREALRGLDKDQQGWAALDDPETFLRYAKAIMQQVEASRVPQRSLGDKIANVLNVPRAIMSSMDLSAPLRQGLYYISTKEYWAALPAMFKAASPQGGEAFFKAVMDSIENHPNYRLMMKAGLSFSSIDGPIGHREESFQSEIAQRVPGVRLSERAYTAFLNKLRADLFNKYVELMKQSGNPLEDPSSLKALGAWINAGTGRGNLPNGMAGAAPLLNALFFSPRLISSRVQLLGNPALYSRLPPPVRKAAIRQTMAFGTIAVMTLSLLAMAIPEAEVEIDPRSSDFGKLKVGNTRYDMLGGFSQYLTLGARLAAYTSDKAFGFDPAGHRKTTSGAYVDYSNEFGATSALDAVITFLRNKASPNASFAMDFLAGENSVGEEFTFSSAVTSRILPMFINDAVELVNENGLVTGSLMAAPVLFGVGVNTYTPKEIDTDQRLSVSDTFTASEYADGSNDMVTISNGTVTLSEDAQIVWENTLNDVFADIMQQRIAEEDWPNLSREEKEKAIDDAKTLARRETKQFMLGYLGLE